MSGWLLSSGDSKANRFTADRDEYGADTMSEINIIGRITLNLWRVMKTEVAAADDLETLLANGLPILLNLQFFKQNNLIVTLMTICF